MLKKEAHIRAIYETKTALNIFDGPKANLQTQSTQRKPNIPNKLNIPSIPKQHFCYKIEMQYLPKIGTARMPICSQIVQTP